jgi:hypothetical protein
MAAGLPLKPFSAIIAPTLFKISNRGAQGLNNSMEHGESDEKSDSIPEMEHHLRPGGIGK